MMRAHQTDFEDPRWNDAQQALDDVDADGGDDE